MRRATFLAGILLALSLGTASASSITINVYPALAPNAFGSPSYPAWQTNTVSAMMNNGASTGTVGTPSYFEQNSNVTTSEVVVTGFPSWLGEVDPGTSFGAGYTSELGNRMTFPVWVNGGGEQFSISQMGFEATSSDPFNGLGFAFAPGNYNYSAGYVGLDYVDGVKGNGNDVLVTGGANTKLVNELFGRGSGNSFAAYCPLCNFTDQQTAINNVAAYPGEDFSFTGLYYILSGTNRIVEGSGTFNVDGTPGAAPVPEPASLVLLGTGILATVARRRKKTQVVEQL